MWNTGWTFDSRSGIRNQYCCLSVWTQDSQWFKSCLSTTLAVCQVISQALSLEFRGTHTFTFIPTALHPSPSIQPYALFLLSLLCPFSLFSSHLSLHTSITATSSHPPLSLLIYLRPHLNHYLSPFLPLSVLSPLSCLKCLNYRHLNLICPSVLIMYHLIKLKSIKILT